MLLPRNDIVQMILCVLWKAMFIYSACRGACAAGPHSKHRSMLYCICSCAPEHMRCHLHQERLTQHSEPWLHDRRHVVCTCSSGHRSIRLAPFSRNSVTPSCLSVKFGTGSRESHTTACFHTAVEAGTRLLQLTAPPACPRRSSTSFHCRRC